MSTLGVIEVNAEESTVDVGHEAAYGPAFKVLRAFNPRSAVIGVNRVEGVTRALLAPRGSESSVLAGKASVVHFGDERDFVVREDAGVVAYLGESGSRNGGGSRSSALMLLSDALMDAEDYRDNQQDYEEGSLRELGLGRSDLEALQDVLAGKEPLIVDVDRASDILETLKMADHFNVEVVIAGGAEAWMVAEEIADAEALVLLNPMLNLPDSFASLNSRLENAIKLDQAGVKFGFTQGGAHNARNITQLAGNAVANGLNWETALRAITTTPAQYFSGDDNCCGIAVGEPADFVVWDGDPLEVTTYAKHVFANGKSIKMKSRQTQLRDRYLELNDPLPFQYRK